jgi:hypothetical protein
MASMNSQIQSPYCADRAATGAGCAAVTTGATAPPMA